MIRSKHKTVGGHLPLTALTLALTCSRRVHAEDLATPATTDLAPALARVPRQIERDPFASLVAGFDVAAFVPLSRTWQIPSPGAGFTPRERATHGELALRVGGLHFHGHADLCVTLPLAALTRDAPGGGTTSLEHMTVAGAKIYPWALRPGTVRPYVSTGLLFRSLKLGAVADDLTTAAGSSRATTIPIGVGLAWRTPWHFMLDAQVQYISDSTTLNSGVTARPLSEAPEAMSSRFVDLSGFRFVLGLNVDYNLSGAGDPGFRERAAAALQRRIDNGSISTLYVAIGPSAQVAATDSSYFAQRRTYMQGRYNVAAFPHANVGYYVFDWDAEVRLAYRGISGGAHAYGVDFDTRQDAVFLEAIKQFDFDYYGFVPFLGAGVGYGWLRATDTAMASTVEGRTNRLLASVVFGFDVRVNPASWWSLRTNFRWVPHAKVDLPGSATTADLGGLEFDFIQLVVYPERIWR